MKGSKVERKSKEDLIVLSERFEPYSDVHIAHETSANTLDEPDLDIKHVGAYLHNAMSVAFENMDQRITLWNTTDSEVLDTDLVIKVRLTYLNILTTYVRYLWLF